MYAFAARPRWVALHIAVALVVGLFALAGWWQLNRLSERRERNALVRERRGMPPAAIGDVLGDPDRAAHRRIKAVGRYDTGREFVLLGRSGNGLPGNHMLTPLVLPGGRAVIVDRGWVPPETESPRAPEALPPDGRVEVLGIALPSEVRGPLAGGGDKLGDAVSRIDVARMGQSLPYETFPLYLVLQKQDPAQPGDVPDPVSLPEVGEGPHLIYAVQWFAFIPIALIGYGAIIRREARKRTAPTATT